MWRILMWFSHTIFKAPSLIFSKSQASQFSSVWRGVIFKTWLFCLVQISWKFLSGHVTCTVSHSEIWGKTEIMFVRFSCMPRNRPKPKGFALLLSALLPPDGTKAQGKVLGCKVGLGEKSIPSEWWNPAPMASHLQDPSNTPGHWAAIWTSQLQVHGRAAPMASVSFSPGLNLSLLD